MVKMPRLNLHSSEKSYFLSGLIAFIIYLFCIVSILFYLSENESKKIDAMQKNTILQLEIIVDNTQKIQKSTSKPVKKVIKKEEKIVEKSKSVSITKTADLKSLFSKVKTKAKKVEKKEVVNVKKSLVSSRFRSNFEKQRKSENIKVSNILDDVTVKSRANVSMDSKYDKDPYYSKIYEMLGQRWNNVITFDELFASVLITITSSGGFDYRIIKGSGDETFDEALKDFLQNQKLELYPAYTKGSKTQIEVIFKSKN